MIKPESHRFARVIATIYEMEIAWVQEPDMSRMYINFNYVLSDEDGEFHKPKDSDRREIAMSPATEQLIRQRVLSDAMALAAR